MQYAIKYELNIKALHLLCNKGTPKYFPKLVVRLKPKRSLSSLCINEQTFQEKKMQDLFLFTF